MLITVVNKDEYSLMRDLLARFKEEPYGATSNETIYQLRFDHSLKVMCYNPGECFQ